MSPSIWVLLLMFVLGAALTWFAMVVSVTRQIGVAGASTGEASEVARYRGDAPPREGDVPAEDDVRRPDHPDRG